MTMRTIQKEELFDDVTKGYLQLRMAAQTHIKRNAFQNHNLYHLDVLRSHTLKMPAHICYHLGGRSHLCYQLLTFVQQLRDLPQILYHALAQAN